MNKSRLKSKIVKNLFYIFDTNGYYVYALYCLIAILITYLTKNFVLTSSVYEDYFGQQLPFEKVSQIISYMDKWEWLSYVFIPVFYLIKFFAISICILTGLMISDIKISFNKIFKIVLVSEIIFLLASIIKTFYFLFINISFTFEEFQYYYPLSIINYFNTTTTKLEVWLKYPLQLVNLFELFYILLISLGLSITLRIKSKEAFKIVSLSYLSGLIIWLVFITFLTVNFKA